MAAKRKAYTKLQCTSCKEINYFAHKSLLKNRKEGEQRSELPNIVERLVKLEGVQISHFVHKNLEVGIEF